MRAGAGSNVPAAVAGVYHRAVSLVRDEFEERTWKAFWRVVIDGQRPRDVAGDGLGVDQRQPLGDQFADDQRDVGQDHHDDAGDGEGSHPRRIEHHLWQSDGKERDIR